MAAIECGKRGRRVVILERAQKPGEKIRISGGGRCNFTNIHTTAANFISDNPRFCISALARYTPRNFIEMLERHGIAYHEKKLGQLFCDDSSKQIIDMLRSECASVGVEIRLGVEIEAVEKTNGFRVKTPTQIFEAGSLIVASGGKSIPKMGATGIGYDIAQQFGLGLIPTVPALVPLTFDGPKAERMKELAGLSVETRIHCKKTHFDEALLFTHRGLSGPAILQISSYWDLGERIVIDLLPAQNAYELLKTEKQSNPKQTVSAFLNGLFPKRLAATLAQELGLAGQFANVPDKTLQALANRINEWHVQPNGSEGYRTAEVTRGGVDTGALSSKTLETKAVPGLYFIGEVVDVTGHLGGFNFQWAWASGYTAGQYA